MADLACDVAIIGAGTAGLAAERADHFRRHFDLLLNRAARFSTIGQVWEAKRKKQGKVLLDFPVPDGMFALCVLPTASGKN